ncbi:hypothetical protein [Conexibacter woesei]|uniref:hypothetical protein n=1 Tax=Conexibacter woesei TaxID=191495 RepID=UPI0002D9C97C|nr:hypothetical protein [Conexibacter woesei]
MAVEIHSTGVLIRAATAAEVTAIERAGHFGGEFELDPPRSYRFSAPTTSPGPDEIYVVSVAFVDFTYDGKRQRWTEAEHNGTYLTTTHDVTTEPLALGAKPRKRASPDCSATCASTTSTSSAGSSAAPRAAMTSTPS